ncbi:MAG: putative selenium-dependent hydroxylase accessory protein YqeC [Planctomycetes bacterium]|nr:putative selenium-dependent hydroxylase accessory protein YqeC [Planctomycetota bacterium]MBI3846517.1 putative selenium-dependent hydroxylase accessory protein YqeC [Planctomycetota bacterium]
MHAVDAFPIREGDVVCFVGGGGKTSLLYGCGEALAAVGRRVLSTTTTRVEVPSAEQCNAWAWDHDEARLLARIPSLLGASRHVAAARRGEYTDRFVGVSDEFVSRAIASRLVDVVLVEGDGARHRHLKAPKDGEPATPSATTLYVPIAGMDVVGQPLTDEFVHRAELAASLAGVPIGTILDPTIVAAIFLHPHGLCGKAPAAARVVPFLSFCEGAAATAAAHSIGGAALRSGGGRIRRVLLGTANDQTARVVLER